MYEGTKLHEGDFARVTFLHDSKKKQNKEKVTNWGLGITVIVIK